MKDTATSRSRRVRMSSDAHWMLGMLPSFPLVLLVLRLWHLSRKDLPTMLVLLQYANPVGLISALVVMLIWMLPAAILTFTLFGALRQACAWGGEDAHDFRLVSLTDRIPTWVVVLAILLAALTWQLRFLPTLVMVSLAILGLTTRHSPDAPARIVFVRAILPATIAVTAYLWLGQAIVDCCANREWVTLTLLIAPPGFAILLTGPPPVRAARFLTRWVAFGAAIAMPFLAGAVFLRTPVLPLVALEVSTDRSEIAFPQIRRGRIVTVDDSMTTFLDLRGVVHFIPNDQIVSKTLCPEDSEVPFSKVTVHAWPVEQASLSWLTASRTPSPTDPRCQGRPLIP